MKLTFTIDTSKVLGKMAAIKSVPQNAMPAIYNEFVKNTPVRTGNARNHTFLNGLNIYADYEYASRLDEGYSKQSPDGMTNPTEAFAKNLLTKMMIQAGKK